MPSNGPKDEYTEVSPSRRDVDAAAMEEDPLCPTPLATDFSQRGGERLPPARPFPRSSSFFSSELLDSLNSAHIVYETPLDSEESLILADDIQCCLDFLMNSLKRATSTRSLRRLLASFEERLMASKKIGGSLSCLSPLLHALNEFCVHWSHLEDEAKPRTSVAQISTIEAQLDVAKNILVVKSEERASIVTQQRDLRGNISALKTEIVEITRRRKELWDEYQQLGESLAWKECLLSRHTSRIDKDEDVIRNLDLVIKSTHQEKAILEDSLGILQASKVADSEAVLSLATCQEDFVKLKDQLMPILGNLRDKVLSP